MLALGGEIDAVVEIAGHHVGAAADHGLERLRAALEVDHLDIDAGLLELAELLGEHGRQIAQAAGAADGERDLGLREREARRQQQRGERSNEPPDEIAGMNSSLVCFRPLRRPFRARTISQRGGR